jgi:hypothetical protein
MQFAMSITKAYQQLAVCDKDPAIDPAHPRNQFGDGDPRERCGVDERQRSHVPQFDD